jgi:amino acid transporter
VDSKPISTQTDDSYLREFGVEPRLKRAIGYIAASLFAIAFQGPTTGALLITGVTLALGGPRFIWAIPIILLFQFIVALSWAELASHYPLEGGIYQWAKYLGGEMWGWFTGAFYLVAIILVMPAVGLVINIVLSSLMPDKIGFNNETEIVISFLSIIATGLLIATSVRIVALINSVGVALELVILLGTAVALLTHHHQSLSVLTKTGGVDAHQNYLTPFLIVVALVITQFVGFETAGAFAEETHESRIKPSRAILTAIVGAAVVVFIFDLALLVALPNVTAAMSQPETVIPATLQATFGTTGKNIFLIGAFVAVASTSIATLAAIVRTIYSMARDGQLPGSSYLTHLSARTDEPIYTIIVACVLSMIPLLFIQHVAVIVAAITAMILIPYTFVLALLLLKRFAGWPTVEAPFSLGSRGMALTGIGLVWVVIVLVDSLWRRPETNPDLGPLPVIWEFAGVTLILGAAWWFLYLRNHVPEQPVSPEPTVRIPAAVK